MYYVLEGLDCCLFVHLALSRVAAPPTFTPSPPTRRPYSIAGLPVNFSDHNNDRSTPPVVPPPILPRPLTQQFTGEYVDDEITGYQSESDCSSVDQGVVNKVSVFGCNCGDVGCL